MTPAADPAPAQVLGPRALGRATLARQHLLERADTTALALIDQLVGLQAQAPWAPYAGLWSRLDRFTHADLADRLLDRSAARIVVMRSTIHLLTADDALALPGVVAPALAAGLRTNPLYGKALRTVDVGAVAAAARELLEGRPMGAVELGLALARTWPDVDPPSLAQAARALLPLVQVPPRAIWGRSGATTWTTANAWHGRSSPDLEAPGARDAALDALVLRYLAAFGPASAADAQRWSGLTRLGPVFDRLRPELETFRSVPGPGARGGRELFDLPAAPRPAPDVPAPVRFLPEFDNLTVAHADRARIISDEHRRRLWRANGAVPGTVLIDGVVAAGWTIARAGRAGRDATLAVEAFGPLSRADRAAVEAEGDALVRFMADDAATHQVEIVA